jgi:hypothetical protein
MKVHNNIIFSDTFSFGDSGLVRYEDGSSKLL